MPRSKPPHPHVLLQGHPDIKPAPARLIASKPICTHSRKPGPCSQCLGATPKIVTVTEHAVLVDGKKVRGTERSSAPFAGQRGYR